MEGGLHRHVPPNLIVRVSGADRAGIVAKVTGVLTENGFNVLDLESDVAGNADKPVYIMQIAGIAAVPVESLEAALDGLRAEGIDVNISPIDMLVG
jgi:glycine cleavage system transcriptional repressor